ncbi:unnamed protein product [Phytomonas sp. Hart1]|nr:unnamed protein product [Phytomonas sp. Hart1]|eukprot:CCW67175.1 unnamed protein product [Phytomonas sp. isolate Hart1]
MPSEAYNVGCYLLDRLVEMGCNRVFGVPGDYNLRFLDDVVSSKGLGWVGCCNELNGAYAADGYARIRGIGAVLTTYGVGELSALNALAGAYAECNPVVHIVGAPSTVDADAQLMKHHTLGDGFFQHFCLMSEQISCATTRLTTQNAVIEIDRVLTEIRYQRKPGYIMLPMDVAVFVVDPPVAPMAVRQAELCPESLKAFAAGVDEKLRVAKRPAALVGYLCDRYACNALAQKLVDKAGIPFAHMLLGKGALNEQSATYIGCYFGATCNDYVRTTIEESDACVLVGVKFHDFGTGYFSHKIDSEKTIDILPFCSRIGLKRFPQIPMAMAIEAVFTAAMKYCSAWPKSFMKPPSFDKPNSDKFNGHHFWSEVQAGLTEGDIVVVDQGTSSAASAGLILPKNGTLIVQCLWGSIGYSIPAAFGAQMAMPERRVVLAVGDGSAQMTVQELGSFMRFGLHPVIFLVNNDGYVIERIIHGWNAEYNDIATWNWKAVIKALTVKDEPEAVTVQEPGKILPMMERTQKKRDKLTFIEVMLGRHEMPIVALMPFMNK